MQQLNNQNESHSFHVKKLSDTILKIQQFSQILNLNQNELSKLISQLSTNFHKDIQIKFKKVLFFLANYHKFINLYAIKNSNPFTNNLAIHFILLLSYSRIRKNQLQQGKNILKNIWNYTQIAKCSNILLSISLSNLCFLYIKKQKYFKALNCTFKVIQIMGKHLHDLKQQKNKNQIIQDSVILINSFIQSKKILTNIIKFNHKKFYYDLFNYINQIGYKCSKKYLGKLSQFTKTFDPVQSIEKLPIFIQNLQQRSTLQEKILKQLQSIYQVLKTKRQPQVIYLQPKVQQKIIQPQPQSVIDIKQISQAPKYQIPDQMKQGQSVHSVINNWNVQGKLLRPIIDQVSKNNQSKFIIGNILLNYQWKDRKMTTIILAQKMKQILSMIDLYNCIPYEYTLKRLTDYQFFTAFIYRLMWIDQGGNLQFTIKKKSMFKPFIINFLKDQCLFFFYHINGNNYRISLSPLNLPQSINLNATMILDQMLKIEQSLPEVIYQKYNKIKQHYYNKQIQIIQLKRKNEQFLKPSILVINQNKLIKKLQEIIKDFQFFLIEQQKLQENDSSQNKSLNLSQFFNNYQYDLNNIYYAYVENKIKENQAKFICLKYLDNIESIEVAMQNNFKSYTIDDQIKAKGSITIYGQKFKDQFGVQLEYFHKEQIIKVALEIIAKKFQLKVFFQPLKTRDEDLYHQNAIFQLPLICKSYRRAVIDDQNGYKVPVTISHLTINNEIPVGLKVQVNYPFQGSAQLLVKAYQIN